MLPFDINRELLTNYWNRSESGDKETTVFLSRQVMNRPLLRAIYTRQVDFCRNTNNRLTANVDRLLERDVYDFGHLLKNRDFSPLPFMRCILRRYDSLPDKKREFAKLAYQTLDLSCDNDVASQCICWHRYDLLDLLVEECGLTLQFQPQTSRRQRTTNNSLLSVAFKEGSIGALRCFKEHDMYSSVANPVKQIRHVIYSLMTVEYRDEEHHNSVLACFDYLFEEIGWNLRENEDDAANLFYLACELISFQKSSVFEKIRSHLLFDPETMTLNLMHLTNEQPQGSVFRESLLFFLGRDKRFDELKYICDHYIRPGTSQFRRADGLNELDVICAGIVSPNFSSIISEKKSEVFEQLVRDLVAKGVEFNSRLQNGQSTLTWAIVCKCIPAPKLVDLFKEHNIHFGELDLNRMNARPGFDPIWLNHSLPFLLQCREEEDSVGMLKTELVKRKRE